MKTKYLYFWVIVSLAAFVWGCSSEDVPAPTTSVLVSAEQVIDLNKEDFFKKLQSGLGADAGQLSFFVQSGIKAYKVVYRTKGLDESNLVASGVLLVPKDIKEAMALGSIQHGTLFDEAQAPSYLNFQSEFALGAFLASSGFIIAMPDYLGYGESKTYPHPYEHAKGLAKPNVDFLLAIKEVITKEKLNWNKNLLLAGYSEGGYATMATYKLLEESYKDAFQIKAVSCGAGAYNKSKTLTNFLSQPTSGEEVNNRSYIWVLLAYDRIYKFNQPLATYFVEPYLSEISKNGVKASIKVSFDKILNPIFTKSLLDGTNIAWLNAIKENDVHDWRPSQTIRLYHGDKDTYVPFINSQTAYEAMTKKGAQTVSLHPVSGGTHGSSVGTFFLGTFDLFNKNKN
jgi:pimeloyl-ACP methyl ester carboxylesterase